MTEKHTCPRRVENGMDREDGPFKFAGQNRDTWDERKPGGPPQCSYCGSVAPGYFLEQLQLGKELGVTDKNYKAYLDYAGGHFKFYYQHLSIEQRREFVDLFNQKKVVLGWPGYFTVLPYFMRPA